ncbi:MAG: ABC transporter permease [Myxococcota bacterium]
MPSSSSSRDPRVTVRPRPAGWVARLGRVAIERYRAVLRAWRTLRSALQAAPGAAAARVVHYVSLRQMFFTGVQGLPAVTTTALVLGATIILQTRVVAPGITGELLGGVLTAVVLRELAPLVTAIIVASRSGTAMATELGNMRAGLEMKGLASLGIDPGHYVVRPRLVASVVSILVLIVYFDVMAIAGSTLTAAALGGPDPAAIRSGVTATLDGGDLLLYFVKGGGNGLLVGWLCCHFGMQVRSSTTEVPMMSGRAVIWSIVGCVLYSFAVTIVYYAAVTEAF